MTARPVTPICAVVLIPPAPKRSCGSRRSCIAAASRACQYRPPVILACRGTVRTPGIRLGRLVAFSRGHRSGGRPHAAGCRLVMACSGRLLLPLLTHVVGGGLHGRTRPAPPVSAE